MGSRPQPSTHLPGTQVPEASAELARQLVARVCAAHMQRAAAAVAEGQQEKLAAADFASGLVLSSQGQPAVTAAQPGPPQLSTADEGWHSTLCTLYEVRLGGAL